MTRRNRFFLALVVIFGLLAGNTLFGASAEKAEAGGGGSLLASSRGGGCTGLEGAGNLVSRTGRQVVEAEEVIDLGTMFAVNVTCGFTGLTPHPDGEHLFQQFQDPQQRGCWVEASVGSGWAVFWSMTLHRDGSGRLFCTVIVPKGTTSTPTPNPTPKPGPGADNPRPVFEQPQLPIVEGPGESVQGPPAASGPKPEDVQKPAPKTPGEGVQPPAAPPSGGERP